MDESCSLWLPASRRGDAELCREFGISRKTGYRFFDRLSGMWHAGAH